MKKLKTTSFIVLLCFFQTLVFSQSEKMSLEDAIKYAIENTNSTKVSLLGIKDADLAIQQGKAIAKPQVTASSQYNYFLLTPQSVIPDFISPTVYGVLNTEGIKDGNGNVVQQKAPGAGVSASFVLKNQFSIGGQVSQLLYSASYQAGLKAIDASHELAINQLSQTNMNVRNAVTDAYIPALLITEAANTYDKNIKNLEVFSKELKATYKAGFIEQLDVDRIELTLQNLRSERENLDRTLELAQNGLKLVIGYPIEKKLEPSDDINSLLPKSDEAELNAAINFKNRADYNVLTSAEKLTALNIDLNKAAYMPTVAGFASFTENLNSNNYFSQQVYSQPQSVIGVTASINIFDGFATKSKIERAQLALKQLQLQRSDAERGITLQVINARISYLNEKRRLENQNKTLELAQRIYDTAQKKYKAGVGSSLEIISAQTDLYTAQQNVRTAQYNIIAAFKSIQKALGIN